MQLPPAVPRVTIIIPCFNQANYLPEAVQSVIDQTHKNWDCIIIDDGSTDSTATVGSAYQEADPRIKYLRKNNGGLSSARNLGLDNADGDYIQFLDSDDYLHPLKLELQVAALKGAPDRSVSICDYRFGCGERALIDLQRGNLNKPRFKTRSPYEELIDRWESEFSIPNHAFLFNAKLFNSAQIRFDENLPNHEDWDCWLQVFRDKVFIVHLAAELVTYRIRPDSMSTNWRNMWRGVKKVCEKHAILSKGQPSYVEAFLRKRRKMSKIYRNRRVDEIIIRMPPDLIDAYRRWMPLPILRLIRRRHR